MKKDRESYNKYESILCFLVVEPGTIRENLLALVVTFLRQLVLRIVRVGSPTCPNLVNDRKTHLTAMTDNQKDLHHICL